MTITNIIRTSVIFLIGFIFTMNVQAREAVESNMTVRPAVIEAMPIFSIPTGNKSSSQSGKNEKDPDDRFKGALTPSEGFNRDLSLRAQSCVKDEENGGGKKLLEQVCRSEGGQGSGCEKPDCSKMQYKLGGDATAFNGNTADPKADKTDCSSAVASAFGQAGLPIKPNEKPGQTRLTTAMLAGMADKAQGGKSDGCLEVPKLTKDDQLRAGYVLNTGSPSQDGMKSPGHVVMVTRAGKDAFGCSKGNGGNPEHWDFDITHSSSGGLTKDKGSGAGGKIVPGLRKLAVKTCSNRDNGKPISISSGKGAGKKFSVLRHLGNKKEGCLKEPPKAKGEACLKGCYRET